MSNRFNNSTKNSQAEASKSDDPKVDYQFSMFEASLREAAKTAAHEIDDVIGYVEAGNRAIEETFTSYWLDQLSVGKGSITVSERAAVLLDDPDPNVALNALLLIANQGEAGLPQLMAATSHPYSPLAITAAEALLSHEGFEGEVTRALSDVLRRDGISPEDTLRTLVALLEVPSPSRSLAEVLDPLLEHPEKAIAIAAMENYYGLDLPERLGESLHLLVGRPDLTQYEVKHVLSLLNSLYDDGHEIGHILGRVIENSDPGIAVLGCGVAANLNQSQIVGTRLDELLTRLDIEPEEILGALDAVSMSGTRECLSDETIAILESHPDQEVSAAAQRFRLGEGESFDDLSDEEARQLKELIEDSAGAGHVYLSERGFSRRKKD